MSSRRSTCTADRLVDHVVCLGCGLTLPAGSRVVLSHAVGATPSQRDAFCSRSCWARSVSTTTQILPWERAA